MIKLRTYQQECIDAILADIKSGIKRTSAVIPTGGGKGHPLDTEVPTPDGLRLWGDLEVGDYVYGADGAPTQVTAIFDRGVLPTYRVTMLHGESVLVDGDHLWQVQRKNNPPQIVSTAFLADQPMRNSDGFVWAVPVAGAVQRPATQVPLASYAVGALVDSGGTNRMASDNEVIDHVIPRFYLEADVDDRIALLQGLMSARDAGCRSVVYHTTSPGLADDIRELVTSLGGTCSISIENHECVEYQCSILMPTGTEPLGTSGKTEGEPRSAIISVEPEGSSLIRCITVAADDHLYLITRNHIVTHNTIIFASLAAQWRAEHGGRVLILAHREELIRQAADKYLSVNPGAHVGVVKADENDVDADIVVASVQTLYSAQRREQIKDVSLVICDECFPAGTMVGTKPIEQIKEGDFVPSYDESTGDVVLRRVTATMRRTPEKLVKVRLSDGRSFACTPNHPLMTDRGWVSAGMSYGASVLSFTHDTEDSSYRELHCVRDTDGTDRPSVERLACWTSEDLFKGVLGSLAQCCRKGTSSCESRDDSMRCVWNNIRGKQGQTVQVPSEWSCNLLSGMPPTQNVTDDGCDKSHSCIGAHECEQSDASRKIARGDAGNSSENRPSTSHAGREWQTHTSTAENVGRLLGMEYRSGGEAVRRRNAIPLQTRYRTPDDDGVRGSGRGVPLLGGAPRIGHTSGRTASFARVVDVQILESGRDGTYGGMCPDGFVYNLEVEGTHTYLINEGLTVHNCHHFAAEKFLEVINHYNVTTVGFTATMDRGDGRALGDVWEKISYEKSILWMIRKKYLCDVRGVHIKVPGLDLSSVRRSGKDLNESDLGDSLMEAMAPSVVAKAYREHAADMPGVVFTPTVDTALAVAEAFRTEGFATQAVWGNMPTADRARVIKEYDDGELQVLVSVMTLTEGWDAPRAQCAVIMRPTKSTGLFCQMAGRVLRLSPGKPHALILDVVGVSSELELATLNVLTGERKMKPLAAGQSLLEALDKDDARLAKEEAEVGYVGETDHAEVDLFGGSRQQWLRTYGGHWFIPAGERFIAIMPIKDSTSVDVAYFYNIGSRGGGYIARNIPNLEYAMAHGESDITDDEEVIARKAGKWRKRKATAAQMAYCKRIKLTVPDDGLNALRAGVVSDAIAIHTASARMDKKVAALLG